MLGVDCVCFVSRLLCLLWSAPESSLKMPTRGLCCCCADWVTAAWSWAWLLDLQAA